MINELYDFEEDINIECGYCDGMGGFDVSTDCEVYDDWHDCEHCEGTGLVNDPD